jgi:MinD superfamily P-loop ATPase
MKQITIISGKGGTGKTTLAACLAELLSDKVMADCDVDAADLHLLLHPTVREEGVFKGLKTAHINPEKCIECDRCIEACRYDAISPYVVDPSSCEGCGLCTLVCPADAVEMVERISGRWFVSDTEHGPMAHAKLGIAQENSGLLVSAVRKRARQIAERNALRYVLIDGPPGIGCPVISSLADVDLVLVVTEPTLSGIHDMIRVLDLVNYFKIGCAVCVNKSDINEKNTAEIRQYCRERDVPIVGEIPFDENVVRALVRGQAVTGYGDGPATKAIKAMSKRLQVLLDRIPEKAGASAQSG